MDPAFTSSKKPLWLDLANFQQHVDSAKGNTSDQLKSNFPPLEWNQILRGDFTTAAGSSESPTHGDRSSELFGSFLLTDAEFKAFANNPVEFIKSHAKLSEADAKKLTAMPAQTALDDATNWDVARAIVFGACGIYLNSFLVGKLTANMAQMAWLYPLISAGLNAVWGETLGGAIMANYGMRPNLDGKAFEDFNTALGELLVRIWQNTGTPEDAAEIKKFKDAMIAVEKTVLDRIKADEKDGKTLPFAFMVERVECTDGKEPSVAELLSWPMLGAYIRHFLTNLALFSFSVSYCVSQGVLPLTREHFGGPDASQKLMVQGIDALTTIFFGFVGAITGVGGMNLGRKYIQHAPPGKVGLHSHLVHDVRIKRIKEKLVLLQAKKTTLTRAYNTVIKLEELESIDEREADRIKNKLTLGLENLDKTAEELRSHRKQLGSRIGREVWQSGGLLKATLAGEANDAPVAEWAKGRPLQFRTLARFLGYTSALFLFLNHMLLLQNQFALFMPYGTEAGVPDHTSSAPPLPGSPGSSQVGPSPVNTSWVPEALNVTAQAAASVAGGISKVVGTSIGAGWSLIAAWQARLLTMPAFELFNALVIRGVPVYIAYKIATMISALLFAPAAPADPPGPPDGNSGEEEPEDSDAELRYDPKDVLTPRASETKGEENDEIRIDMPQGDFDSWLRAELGPGGAKGLTRDELDAYEAAFMASQRASNAGNKKIDDGPIDDSSSSSDNAE